jgi:hypothetical protein
VAACGVLSARRALSLRAGDAAAPAVCAIDAARFGLASSSVVDGCFALFDAFDSGLSSTSFFSLSTDFSAIVVAGVSKPRCVNIHTFFFFFFFLVYHWQERFDRSISTPQSIFSVL